MSNDLEPEVNPEFIRKTYDDLSGFNDSSIQEHYRAHGFAEGRWSARLAVREAVGEHLEGMGSVLEIGPFFRPLCRGDHVRYFDVLSTEELRERAKKAGFNPRNVPDIHFLSRTADLGIVNGTFEAVVSSHVIEHQPDLVGHLNKVARLLEDGGYYFLIVPHRDYCYDAQIPVSTVDEVIEAAEESRQFHTLSNVIRHRAFTTHADTMRHWDGDHGGDVYGEGRTGAIRSAVDEYNAKKGTYIDVHAWQFTPDSFRNIMNTVHDLQYTGMKLERCYNAPWGRIEFTAILRKQPLS